MKLLIIAGCANDVFISNFAKWIKQSMDIEIDIYGWTESPQEVDMSWYNSVYTSKYHFCLGGLPSIYSPFLQARELKLFLEQKHYDIIHCHWITAPLVMCYNALKLHGKHVFCTFWGGEFIQMEIMLSRKLYRFYINRFLRTVDCIINSESTISDLMKQYPYVKEKCKTGQFGSAAADFIQTLLENNSESNCKDYYRFPKSKIVIQLGYSGKKLHQYIPIINEIVKQDVNKDQIHLLAPMTRGGCKEYQDEVEMALKNSGYTYTLLRNRFLSDDEIGKLRCATDITLQLSTFDGFSRSIVEAFCARSLVIYGNWLNYKEHLKKNEFDAIPAANIEEAINVLKDVISNFTKFTSIRDFNSRKALQTSSWSECIKDWVQYYKEVL